MKKLWLIGSCVAAMIAVPAVAQTTVGTPMGGNCFPYSCGPVNGLTDYQQEFRAGAFTGSVTFNTLSYSKFTAFEPSPNYDQGTYALSFYYAATSFDALSADLASNRGALIGTFGTFTVGGTAPNVFSLTGATLTYDPTLGDLLLDVTASNTTPYNGSYNTFFNADYAGADTTRAYTTNEGSTGSTTGGLVTTFRVAGAVPEPATWALMMVGFGMVGFGMRRSAKVRTAVGFA